MEFTEDGKLIRSDIWREGEYLDLWSVPHLLSGAEVGIFLHFLALPAAAAFMIAFLVFVIYEMWEVMMKIEETRANRALDVVVGMTSCIPAFFLAPHIAAMRLVGVFVVIGAADIALSTFGWRASQKASALEAKWRAELEHQRALIRARKAHIRRVWHVRQQRRHARRRALAAKRGDVV
jgi:hypothetical protein